MSYKQIEEEIMAQMPNKRPLTAGDVEKECEDRVTKVNQLVTDFTTYVLDVAETDGYLSRKVMQEHLDKVKEACTHCFKLLMIVPHPEITRRKQIWDDLIKECQSKIDLFQDNNNS